MKKMVLNVAALVFLVSCVFQKKASKVQHESTPTTQQNVKKDSTARKLKPYNEIITAKAITQNGLLKVHKVEDRWYFEIVDSLFGRDLLIVNRIFKAPVSAYGEKGLGSDNIGENVVEFSRGGATNKCYVRKKSYVIRFSDSTDNGMYQAVQNSREQPIIGSFEIKAVSPDSAGVVIDVTDYLNTDNDIFSFGYAARGILGYQLRELAYQPDRSYTSLIRSFPLNLEIQTVKTYAGNNGATVFTYELNSSMILLPKQPMRPRYEDKRIGYFSWGYFNYKASEPVKTNRIITRWRLEPKREDIERYNRGELVEPQNPIVYYIDPATPKKWVSYLIQGVNDWQQAFEKAGFKNAIYALEAPTNDSTWSLQDARHSAIVYKSNITENASGPQVSDPRSGEIIETHINWYHNVMQLLKKWYMIQAGPNDSSARKVQFDDALMGRLIRYVCAHEVGHTLGLMHNFRASSYVPVDSLRSKHYIKVNGICPSIMDYARFNYVAQPEDSFSREDLIPRIGIYDEWAIEWGYRWLPSFTNVEDESSYLTKWATSRLEKDKRIWFGSAGFPLQTNYDFKNQIEDLGDNAVKASHYGIQNLKRVIKGLKDWTREPNESYESLRLFQEEAIQQYKRYLFHVANVIGGYSWVSRNVEQQEDGVSFPSVDQQKAAIAFLNKELFATPNWLLDKDLFRLSAGSQILLFINPGDINTLLKLQGEILTKIISYQTYNYLVFQQTTAKGSFLTIDELLTGVEAGIWSELSSREPISIYRRQLQKLFVEQLTRELYPEEYTKKFSEFDKGALFEQLFNDAVPVVKSHLKELLKRINYAAPYFKDKESRMHLIEISDRIKKAMNGNLPTGSSNSAKHPINESGINLKDRYRLTNKELNQLVPSRSEECWNDDLVE